MGMPLGGNGGAPIIGGGKPFGGKGGRAGGEKISRGKKKEKYEWRTTSEAWRRRPHGPTETHWSAIAWRRATKVLWPESESARRGTAARLVCRSDLVDNVLRLVVSQC
jgi:hypothetical protein